MCCKQLLQMQKLYVGTCNPRIYRCDWILQIYSFLSSTIGCERKANVRNSRVFSLQSIYLPFKFPLYARDIVTRYITMGIFIYYYEGYTYKVYNLTQQRRALCFPHDTRARANAGKVLHVLKHDTQLALLVDWSK